MSAIDKIREHDALGAGNSTGMSAIRKRLEMLLAKELLFVTEFPKLNQFMSDEINVPLDLRIKIREDGSYLGVLKREDGIEEQVLFSVGDSVIEVMVSFETVLKKARWKQSAPWTPDP